VGYSAGVGSADDERVLKEGAGLCAECANARVVESNRGSIFLLCELSRSDSRFAKYPRLPVLSCNRYQKKTKISDRP
jgi:hypothetical protein